MMWSRSYSIRRLGESAIVALVSAVSVTPPAAAQSAGEAIVFLRSPKGDNNQTIVGNVVAITPEYLSLRSGSGSVTVLPEQVRLLILPRGSPALSFAIGARYWPASNALPDDATIREFLAAFPPRDTIYVPSRSDRGAEALVGEIRVLSRDELVFRRAGVDRLYSPSEVARVGLDSLTLIAGHSDNTRVKAEPVWRETIERWWSGTPTLVRLLQQLPLLGSGMEILGYAGRPFAQALAGIIFAIIVVGGSGFAIHWITEWRYRRQLDALTLRANLMSELAAALVEEQAQLRILIPTPPKPVWPTLKGLFATAPGSADQTVWEGWVQTDGWGRLVRRWLIVPLVILLTVNVALAIGFVVLAISLWVTWKAPLDDLLGQPLEFLSLVALLMACSIISISVGRWAILGGKVWAAQVLSSRWPKLIANFFGLVLIIVGTGLMLTGRSTWGSLLNFEGIVFVALRVIQRFWPIDVMSPP